MSRIELRILRRREGSCRFCRVTDCAARAAQSDPDQQCPLPMPKWRKVSEMVEVVRKQPIARSRLGPSALRFVRAYAAMRRLRDLVLGSARRQRRDACATCEHRVELGRGLYGCNRCTACGHQHDPFRLLRRTMKCALGKWAT